jgi:hypothetical protein
VLLDLAIGGILTSVLLLNLWSLRATWADNVARLRSSWPERGRLSVHVLAPFAALAVLGARNVRVNRLSEEAFSQSGLAGFDRVIQEQAPREVPLFYILSAIIGVSALAFAIRCAKHGSLTDAIAVLLCIVMFVLLVVSRALPTIIPG